RRRAGTVHHRFRRRLRDRRAVGRFRVRSVERGPARPLRAGRNAARDPDRVLIVLPLRDRDPSAGARLLGPALFLATAGDGDARKVSLWSAWIMFVPGE